MKIPRLPLVSVVIPTYNRKKMVSRLIRSIFSGSYKNIEVIVVDDASTDKTSESIKKSFKRKNLILLRNKKNLFAAGSRNVGLKKAKGKYVFFVDDDNVLDRNTVAELVKVLEENPKIGELGPVNYTFGKDKVSWVKSERNMWTSKTYHQRNLKSLRKNLIETEDIPNAYMVRAEILKRNKIEFRKFFGIMYEESDLAYRIKDLGYKIVVVRKSKIYHDMDWRDDKSFILDERRPYVFARNRVVFHKLYSKNLLQFISVAFFWSWLFGAYYIYNILLYKKSKEFSLTKRTRLSFFYISGIVSGIALSLNGKRIT